MSYPFIIKDENAAVELCKILSLNNETEKSELVSDMLNQILFVSAEHNYVEAMKLLVADKRVNFSVNSNQAIKVASGEGNVEVLKMLLEQENVDPGDSDNAAFVRAIKNNKLETIEILLKDPRVNPTVIDRNIHFVDWCSDDIIILLINDGRINFSGEYDYAFRAMIRRGKTEIVKLLLKDRRCDPTTYNNLALDIVCEMGHIEMIKLLLKDQRINLTSRNFIAIAANSGHKEVIKLLLACPNIDPTQGNNSAILIASKKGYKNIVKILIPRTDLSTITDPNILRIAKKQILSDEDVAKKLAKMMDQYKINGVFIAEGKINLVKESGMIVIPK